MGLGEVVDLAEQHVAPVLLVVKVLVVVLLLPFCPAR